MLIWSLLSWSLSTTRVNITPCRGLGVGGVAVALACKHLGDLFASLSIALTSLRRRRHAGDRCLYRKSRAHRIKTTGFAATPASRSFVERRYPQEPGAQFRPCTGTARARDHRVTYDTPPTSSRAFRRSSKASSAPAEFPLRALPSETLAIRRCCTSCRTSCSSPVKIPCRSAASRQFLHPR